LNHEAFSLNNVKRIPGFIGDYLTPQGLAHWIMDDAHYIKDKGVSIATLSFTRSLRRKYYSYLNYFQTNTT
jgi:hypothetical protein